jgi:hypothetical protein
LMLPVARRSIARNMVSSGGDHKTRIQEEPCDKQ